ncbi:unnamed protein product [Clavelina lepadiformis]|uniref:LAGLIDADG homing endonuclease n=1 Tax=Clavelina lepadiformis TaxID=159417 RepID=A0ABP0FGJ7_CLALP
MVAKEESNREDRVLDCLVLRSFNSIRHTVQYTNYSRRDHNYYDIKPGDVDGKVDNGKRIYRVWIGTRDAYLVATHLTEYVQFLAELPLPSFLYKEAEKIEKCHRHRHNRYQERIIEGSPTFNMYCYNV